MKKFFVFAAAAMVAMSMNAGKLAIWDFSTLTADEAGRTGIINNLGYYADAAGKITNFAAVQTGQGSKTWEDGFKSTVRVKMNGGSFTSDGGSLAAPIQRFFYFDVDGASEVKIWFITGGSGERTLAVTDGTNIVAQGSNTDSSAKNLLTANYSGAAGKLFITCDAAINIYKIEATNVGTTTEYTPAPTGIVNNAAAVQATKIVENGQVVILKGGKKYNAMGAEL